MRCTNCPFALSLMPTNGGGGCMRCNNCPLAVSLMQQLYLGICTCHVCEVYTLESGPQYNERPGFERSPQVVPAAPSQRPIALV